ELAVAPLGTRLEYTRRAMAMAAENIAEWHRDILLTTRGDLALVAYELWQLDRAVRMAENCIDSILLHVPPDAFDGSYEGSAQHDV
ncbi:MAG: hypothetical protein ACRD2A_20815, partial [Vicinamibacterales bacterium]